MEHQTTGCYSHNMPQLPDVAADFPGLQLQPHTDSPSTSEGSESIGVDPPVVGLPDYMGSTASFSDAAAGALQGSHAANNNASWPEQHMLPGEEQLPPSCVMDISAALPKLEASKAVQIKVEAADEVMTAVAAAADQAPPTAAAAAAAAAGDKQQLPAQAAAPGPVLQIQAAAARNGVSSAAAPGQAAAAAPASNGVAVSMPFAAVQQPAAMGFQGLLGAGSSGLGLPVTLSQWPGTAAAPSSIAAGGTPGGQQGMPQVVFIQGPAAAASARTQQQQQQQLAATLNRSASTREQQQRGAAQAGVGKPSLHRCASLPDGGGSSSSGGKGQISHSTVEKQRRDRLNSLIDELSEIVPPADPKYGNDASSVRRPKHVVLSDTINLLKAMQAKLQIEEAEICTLKQQAAAVTAIAAASHQQQGLAAAGSPPHPPGPEGGCGTGLAGLPGAPEGGLPSSGVLVEAGVNCLFVKVNCRDRKGLLADVVSALRTLPVVICTAAITTTKDGTVHDVFEVRVEDSAVTPEDIRCAVHMSLFNSERARSKRLRQDEYPGAC
ncbi:hypothetical protein COO60DRAFT_1703344 [Scenedesmus sp. NREL 46B-D3]|nr:hypothetical protein COO60DRAFT_1703344 [Scenedesmus sp. NREL 46B-D3]